MDLVFERIRSGCRQNVFWQGRCLVRSWASPFLGLPGSLGAACGADIATFVAIAGIP
jgi:hypothetical protein